MTFICSHRSFLIRNSQDLSIWAFELWEEWVEEDLEFVHNTSCNPFYVHDTFRSKPLLSSRLPEHFDQLEFQSFHSFYFNVLSIDTQNYCEKENMNFEDPHFKYIRVQPQQQCTWGICIMSNKKQQNAFERLIALFILAFFTERANMPSAKVIGIMKEIT